VKAKTLNQMNLKLFQGDCLESSGRGILNETQRSIITDALNNFIETLLNVYKDNLLGAVVLLRGLSELNDQNKRTDINSSFVFSNKNIELLLPAIARLGSRNNPIALRELSINIQPIYCLCKGNSYQFKLTRLQEPSTLSNEQRQAISKITGYYLGITLQQLLRQVSPVFEKNTNPYEAIFFQKLPLKIQTRKMITGKYYFENRHGKYDVNKL
jgi:hypothetical protein